MQGFLSITINYWQKGISSAVFSEEVNTFVGFEFREYQLGANYNHINKAEIINNKLEKIPA